MELPRYLQWLICKGDDTKKILKVWWIWMVGAFTFLVGLYFVNIHLDLKKKLPLGTWKWAWSDFCGTCILLSISTANLRQVDFCSLYWCKVNLTSAHDEYTEEEDEEEEEDEDGDYYYADEHDPDTQAALDVEFYTWYFSTHGLSRPSSPDPDNKDRSVMTGGRGEGEEREWHKK